MRKVYVIRGVLMCQRALGYPQFKELRRLTKGRGAVGLTPSGLGQWIDELLEDDLLPRVVALVLQPHEPTVLHRWWNTWRLRRLGLERSAAGYASVASMLIETGPKFAEAVADFFVVNVSWFRSWANTGRSWGTLSPRATPGQMMQVLTSQLFSFAVETSENSNGSRGARP